MKIAPKSFEEFIGQSQVKNQLGIMLAAAEKENRLPPHMLFAGPPGLGKTSLANIIADKLDIPFVATLSSSISSTKDIITLFKPIIRKTGVVFIDEVHRLDKEVFEFLYSVLEDKFFMLANQRIELNDFVFIGASTEEGLMPKPFLDRVSSKFEFQKYELEDLSRIVSNYLDNINIEFDSNIKITNHAANLIAMASQGTPRNAINLTFNVRDFAVYSEVNKIDSAIIEEAFDILGVNQFGLTGKQIRYLKILENKPFTGVQELAVSLGESKETIEKVIEPALLETQLIIRNVKGRSLTEKGKQNVRL